MEHLPVEIIGNILSHLGTARDVVVSSTTCRKWREAYKKYLDTLSFKFYDWPRDITTGQLEILITQTISQTVGLQCLSIHMESAHEFAAAAVLVWLNDPTKTLRSLSYKVRTIPNVHVLEQCGLHKLEALDLDHHSIIRLEPSYQRFTCLKSLSLGHVIISALDLSSLLTVCPRIESLTLDVVTIVTPDSQSSMELSSPTLKCIFAKSISGKNIILKADNLESLHLDSSNLRFFDLIGKGTLKHLKINDINVIHLEIGENLDNLKIVDVSYFLIMLPKFYQMISRASKLRTLRLWAAGFVYQDELIINAETIAISFPELKHLALNYDIRDEQLYNALRGSSTLENVNVLELGWTIISDNFGRWVSGMIGRCPNLEKLVIHGALSGRKTDEEYQMIANFTSFVVGLMRKYIHVDVRFVYQ